MTITKQPWSMCLATHHEPIIVWVWALLHSGLIYQKRVQSSPEEQSPLWLFPSPSLRFLGEIPMSWGPVLKSIGYREGHRVSRNLPQTTQVTESSKTYVAQGSKAPHPCPSPDRAKNKHLYTGFWACGHVCTMCVSVFSNTVVITNAHFPLLTEVSAHLPDKPYSGNRRGFTVPPLLPTIKLQLPSVCRQFRELRLGAIVLLAKG